MFVPPAFAETDLPELHQFIVQNSFKLVVSQVDGLPFATHIPILLRRAEDEYGTLAGHFAQATTPSGGTESSGRWSSRAMRTRRVSPS